MNIIDRIYNRYEKDYNSKKSKKRTKKHNSILPVKKNKVYKFVKKKLKVYSIKKKGLYYLKRLKEKIINPLIKYFPDSTILKKTNTFVQKHSKQNKIIALPTVDWNLKLYQRPQHLAICLSKLNNFYIYGTYNYKDDNVNGFLEINKNLIVTDKYRYFLSKKNNYYVLLLSNQQTITIKNLKNILNNKSKIIYDYIDEIHEDIIGNDKANKFLLKRHKFIMESQCADLVLCVSNKLYNEATQFYPKSKVLLSQNGVNYEHFQVKKNYKNIPKDILKIIDLGKPIIGYYGAIAPWLDYKIINETAKNNPDWQFVFIGLDYGNALKQLNQKLLNIHFLGPKDYKELPNFGVWFDVTIIPFKKGEIAKATSPLKIYEYMAMGKPTVVTEDLLECYGFDGVLISKNNVNDFSIKIETALKERKNISVINKLKKYALENTWEKRAIDINNKLKSNVQKK